MRFLALRPGCSDAVRHVSCADVIQTTGPGQQLWDAGIDAGAWYPAIFCPVSYSASSPPLGSMHVSTRICKLVTTDMSPLLHILYIRGLGCPFMKRIIPNSCNDASDISPFANIAEERFWNIPNIKGSACQSGTARAKPAHCSPAQSLECRYPFSPISCKPHRWRPNLPLPRLLFVLLSLVSDLSVVVSEPCMLLDASARPVADNKRSTAFTGKPDFVYAAGQRQAFFTPGIGHCFRQN